MDEAHITETLNTLNRNIEAAIKDNRLPGFIDDRMLEIEEGDPVLDKLLKHMLSQVGEDCDADMASHLLFVMAWAVFKSGETH